MIRENVLQYLGFVLDWDTDWRIVTFGAASCLGGNLPWDIDARRRRATGFLFCCSVTPCIRMLGVILTAINDWKRALKVQGMEDLTQSTSIVATWDDHESGQQL